MTEDVQTPLSLLQTEVIKMVDCGCCTIDGLAIATLSQWWLELHMDKYSPETGWSFTEDDQTIIDGVYNFEAWRRGYHAARRGGADGTWTPRGTPGHRPLRTEEPDA